MDGIEKGKKLDRSTMDRPFPTFEKPTTGQVYSNQTHPSTKIPMRSSRNSSWGYLCRMEDQGFADNVVMSKRATVRRISWSRHLQMWNGVEGWKATAFQNGDELFSTAFRRYGSDKSHNQSSFSGPITRRSAAEWKDLRLETVQSQREAETKLKKKKSDNMGRKVLLGVMDQTWRKILRLELLSGDWTFPSFFGTWLDFNLALRPRTKLQLAANFLRVRDYDLDVYARLDWKQLGRFDGGRAWAEVMDERLFLVDPKQELIQGELPENIKIELDSQPVYRIECREFRKSECAESEMRLTRRYQVTLVLTTCLYLNSKA